MKYEIPCMETVKALFGIDYLFPYQRLVIENILEAARTLARRDAGIISEETEDRLTLGQQIVVLPTGAGKSLCFHLPALLLEGHTLVIYPILSLMADQERRLRERGILPLVLRGGQSAQERETLWNELKLHKSCIIIANPEVLLTEKVIQELPGAGITHIVIDEAHCISEWGESFRPAYRDIHKIIKAAGASIVTAFTATASNAILEKIKRYVFDGKGAHMVIGNPDRMNISYTACGSVLKDLAVRDMLLKHEKPALVFCSTRLKTEKLTRYLRNGLAGADIRFYHAGLEWEERRAVEDWFFSSEDGVLVTTCAYGMGVDKPNIRTVIHRDYPPNLEAYLQEIGRAGRDGNPSCAIAIWGPEDESALPRDITPEENRRRDNVLEFSRDTRHCRRESLLRHLDYEGDVSKPETGCCDVCEGTASPRLREERTVIEFIYKNQLSFTLDEAAAALTRTKNILWSIDEAREMLLHLIKEHKIEVFHRFPWEDKLILGLNS